jgi:cyclic pyranopterin phosphate synthase
MTAVPVSIGARRDTPEPSAEMPGDGPLVDRHGRVHTDVRLSVTDRCNFRCAHCLPDDDVAFTPRADVLSFVELARVAGVLRDLGITTVRVTGGEPLIRAGIVDFVAALAGLGFDDLSLTTNASRLAALAPDLVAAGLDRVNVSCDSLQPERFARIRRRGHLRDALAGMDAAEAAGLGPVKVNVVLLAGQNDDEILDFARFARATGRPVRFIEFMPLDAAGHWDRAQVVAGREVHRQIHAAWPLEAAGDPADPAPATRYRFVDGQGEIGLISSVTEPFCGTCNRLRITADGAVRNCLFSDDERSLRTVLRSGGDDDAVALAVRRAVWGKRAGHGIDDPALLRPRQTARASERDAASEAGSGDFHHTRRSMSAIGG